MYCCDIIHIPSKIIGLHGKIDHDMIEGDNIYGWNSNWSVGAKCAGTTKNKTRGVTSLSNVGVCQTQKAHQNNNIL